MHLLRRTTARPDAPRTARRTALRRGVTALTAAVLVGGALVVGLPTAASAHVRVLPDTTAAGAWAALTFRVPNESTTATTVAVSVELPTDTPLLSVSTKPVPGWTATVEKGDLPEPVDLHGTTVTQAPVRVTWEAEDGTGVAAGQFQEFAISAGPLPEEIGALVVLPADQTYSDGTVVSWDEVAEGDDAPEHPAPSFVVTAGQDEHADEGGADDASDVSAAAVPAKTSTGDGVARALGATGLALGIVAVVVAVTGRRSAPVGKE
ncbi:YcnI family copper-binding membrane protein [Cellulomonas palmilytica]|uniref:YcnI family copper-binding membrane protein n=1 Tax=Cellulomonas palmilytica TaxID=2608402 RepID=UPI001F3B9D4E|nr:YcnI family protein [Cellulomonas palmilytica]UJP39284.1 YcnI family protein [Cellulomonas palmilytica]